MPYPIFFGLIAVILYLSGIPLMIMTDNLQSFLSDYRWILISIFGAYNGILAIFIFRKFSDSLNGIEHLIDFDDTQKLKNKLMNRLTNRFHWIIVVFWLFINSFIFEESLQRWYWQSLYNNPNLISIYYFVESSPYMIFIGIFQYMILFGLNLAYRDLCLKTPFKKEVLVSEWMKPFKDFRKLITLIMFGAVIYAVFPPNIWSSVPHTTDVTNWIIYIPYTGVTIVLVSTIIFPHYRFHQLFSNARESHLKDIRRQLSQISSRKVEDAIKRIILLLEEARAEKKKTWLIDVKVLGEILIVALMHVILVEAVTTFIHG